MDPLKLQIANSLDALPEQTYKVSCYLESKCVPHEAVYFANLAVEELFSNIVKYGYDDDHAHVVDVEICLNDTELTIKLRDDGHPFDPRNHSEPDTTLPAEERPIGGLGLHLVRQMSDAFDYEFRDGCNCVRVTKNFAPQTA